MRANTMEAQNLSASGYTGDISTASLPVLHEYGKACCCEAGFWITNVL